MEHTNRFAAIIGILSGCLKYFLNINSTEFAVKLLEAGVTALICGFLGVAGKYLFELLKLIIKKRFNKK